MSEEIVVPALTGRVLGTVDDSFVVAEWCDHGGPPGPPRLIAPRHLHRSDDEAWYVLEGTLRLQVDEKEVEARAGSAVLVPPATHCWSQRPTGSLRTFRVRPRLAPRRRNLRRC